MSDELNMGQRRFRTRLAGTNNKSTGRKPYNRFEAPREQLNYEALNETDLQPDAVGEPLSEQPVEQPEPITAQEATLAGPEPTEEQPMEAETKVVEAPAPKPRKEPAKATTKATSKE